MLSQITFKVLIKGLRFIQRYLEQFEFKLTRGRESNLLFANDGNWLVPSHEIIEIKAFHAQASIVPGMTSTRELEALYNLAYFQDLPGNVIEIGSWLGKSTSYLAMATKAADNGIVFAIDTFKGNLSAINQYTGSLEKNQTILSAFKSNMKLLGLADQVVPVPGKNVRWRPKFSKQVRLIFIDACHDYESVFEDANLWADLVKKGGYLCFHDHSPNFPGVVRATQEFLQKNQDFEPCLLVDSLLVLRKK
jgi:predicted O-methyltransferase YrrM